MLPAHPPLKIPSGKRFAYVLAGLFRGMRRVAMQDIQGHRVPDFAKYQEAIMRALLPFYLHDYASGLSQTAHRIERRTRKAEKGYRRKHEGFFGGGSFGQAAAFGFRPQSFGAAAWTSTAANVAVTPGINAAFDLLREQVPAAVKRLALDLAGEVTASTKRDIRRALEEGIREGLGNTQIADKLNFAFSGNRAFLIAQTETSRAMHAGQLDAAAMSGVVKETEWLASSDACDKCLTLNGQRRPLGEPFYVNPKGGTYAVVLHAPLHPNCVLGKTPIGAASLVSACKVQYQGPVVRLYFGCGSDVTVTPNHMLLTRTGFARASDLVEGDDIIRTLARPMNLLPAFGSPDDYGHPIQAEKVFDTFAVSSGVFANCVPSSPEYLHGDAAFANGEINVIGTDGLFSNRSNSRFDQPLEHIPFVSRFGFFPLRPNFYGSRSLATVFKSLLDATNGRVGVSRERAALLRSVPSVANVLSLGHGPWFDSKFAEDTIDDLSADVERLADVPYAFPGIVTTTNLIRIDRAFHDGPVFDFQTNETMYTIGKGIISSNCFCTNIEVIEDE